MIVIVCGVSGCGKTTIGSLLAERLNVPFYDADEFHPPENVRKMAQGIPLVREDRLPWLQNLSRELSVWERSGGAVLACSALKAEYREILSEGKSSIEWLYMKGSKELILSRLSEREGHFMPSSLLDSQFEALEEPDNDVITVDIDKPVDALVDEIEREINRRAST
jgi:gluconokinase